MSAIYFIESHTLFCWNRLSVFLRRGKQILRQWTQNPLKINVGLVVVILDLINQLHYRPRSLIYLAYILYFLINDVVTFSQ